MQVSTLRGVVAAGMLCAATTLVSAPAQAQGSGLWTLKFETLGTQAPGMVTANEPYSLATTIKGGANFDLEDPGASIVSIGESIVIKSGHISSLETVYGWSSKHGWSQFLPGDPANSMFPTTRTCSWRVIQGPGVSVSWMAGGDASIHRLPHGTIPLQFLRTERLPVAAMPLTASTKWDRPEIIGVYTTPGTGR